MRNRSELYYIESYVKIENIQVGLNKQAPESTVVQRIRAVAKAAGPGEHLNWPQSSWINRITDGSPPSHWPCDPVVMGMESQAWASSSNHRIQHWQASTDMEMA